MKPGFVNAGLGIACILGWIQQDAPQRQSSATTARYQAVSEVMRLIELQRARGTDDVSYPADNAEVLWSLRLAESAVAAEIQTPQEAYAGHLARMEKLASTCQMLIKMGRRSALDGAVAAYDLADAHALLELAGTK